MTESEKIEIVNSVLDALRTHSKTIEQLSPVAYVRYDDELELGGGRKTRVSALAEYVQGSISRDLEAIGRRIDSAQGYIADNTEDISLHGSEITALQTRAENAEGRISDAEERLESVEREPSVLEFGGFLSPLFSVEQQGAAAEIEPGNIFYDRANNCFVAKSGQKYYSTWPNRAKYEQMRTGTVYVDVSANLQYRYDGTGLAALTQPLEQGTGSSTDRAMSQKAVSDSLSALQTRAESAEGRLNEAEGRISDAENEISGINRSIEGINADIADCNEDISLHGSEITALQTRTSAAEGRLALLRSETSLLTPIEVTEEEMEALIEHNGTVSGQIYCIPEE